MVYCRLESLVNLYDLFDHDASDMEAWLCSAQHKLTAVGKLEGLEERNVHALRKKMDLLLVIVCFQ